MTVNQRFDEWIKRSGLTGAEVARRIGVSGPFLSDVRNGKRMAGGWTAACIAKLTDGEIAMTDWLSSEERERYEAIGGEWANAT